MSSPVTPMIGPPCLCSLDPCVCFVDGGVYTKPKVFGSGKDWFDKYDDDEFYGPSKQPVEISVGWTRPRKTPLFVPPPAPDGYAIERAPLENSSQKNWVPVTQFYDESRKRKVEVLRCYDSEVTAKKVAKRMSETSWHKEVRVVPYWIKYSDRPPNTNTLFAVAELMTIAKKLGIAPLPGLKTSTGVIEMAQIHDEIVVAVAADLGKAAALNLNQMLEKYMTSPPNWAVEGNLSWQV